MASNPSSESPSSPEKAIPNAYTEGELRSPFIPLLWLLIPFLGVILYGVATSPRFSH